MTKLNEFVKNVGVKLDTSALPAFDLGGSKGETSRVRLDFQTFCEGLPAGAGFQDDKLKQAANRPPVLFMKERKGQLTAGKHGKDQTR